MRNTRGIALAAISIATTVSGLLGQLLLFRFFGAGPLLDLYFYSLALPTFLAGQVALVFGYYLVPFLNRSGDTNAHATLRSGLFGLLVLTGLVVSIPGIALGPLLAPPLPDESAGGPSAWLPWILSALSWSSVLISNVNAGQASFLNFRSSFIVPALFPLVSQVGSVVALILSHGRGIEFALLGLNAGCLAAALLGWHALRSQAMPAPSVHGRRFGLTEAVNFFRSASLVPLALSIFSAHFFIDALLSSRLEPGGLSVLSLAHRVTIGAIGVVVSAFASPMTTYLSACVQQGVDTDSTLAHYLRRLYLYGTAVCVLVFANADGLAMLLLKGGKVTPEAVAALATTLSVLAVAALPMLVGQFLMRALLAMHKQRAGLLAAIVWVCAYLTGALALSRPYGSIGLAGTYLVAWALFSIVALVQTGIHRRLAVRHMLTAAVALGLLAIVAAAVRIVAMTLASGSPTTPGWLITLAVSASLLGLSAAAFDWADSRRRS